MFRAGKDGRKKRCRWEEWLRCRSAREIVRGSSGNCKRGIIREASSIADAAGIVYALQGGRMMQIPGWTLRDRSGCRTQLGKQLHLELVHVCAQHSLSLRLRFLHLRTEAAKLTLLSCPPYRTTMKVETCAFSQRKIYPGKGKLYVRGDSKVSISARAQRRSSRKREL